MTDSSEAPDDVKLVDLRDPETGKLVCKFDPVTRRVQIKNRGRVIWLDIDVLHSGLVMDKGGRKR